MKRSNLKRISCIFLPLFALVFFMFGCNNSGLKYFGTVRVLLTDFPLQDKEVEEVYITISRVEIHSEDTGWVTIVDYTTPDSDGKVFELLELAGGLTAVLGEEELEAGLYTQIRLILSTEHLIVVDGQEEALTIPSGEQTGLKITGDFEVAENSITTITLDFDAEKSVVLTGKGKYKLKPTISILEVTSTANELVVINEIELIYQHKDSSLSCVAGFPPYNGSFPPCGILGAHPWNHVTGNNSTYGDADDCPHCSAYCAPASIAMIANAYGKQGNLIKQDYIYDNGKSTSPEYQSIPPEIQTHGVGMFDGTGGEIEEVQNGLMYALEGMPYDQHDGVTLDWMMLSDYILNDQPVLWLDHGGWPANQSENWPTTGSRIDQGHAKVIAGYDDRGTPGETDDLCLIYDPWPEYNDDSLLPTNASKGPQDTYDPYWLPQSNVLGDSNDIFLIPADSIQ